MCETRHTPEDCWRLVPGLAGVTLLACIVAVADGLLRWDLLPEAWDRIAELAIWVLVLGLAASLVVSVVVSLGRIAEALTAIARSSAEDE